MKRIAAFVAALCLALPAYAQQSSWLWWGATNPVPVSAANPLPVTGAGAPATSLTVGTTTIVGGTTLGLLYDNAGVLGNLATGNSGVLVTDGSGNPSISTTLPTGLAATSLNLTTPLLGVATGTSLALGSPTGGSIANSVNVAGGFYVNNVLLSAGSTVNVNTSSLIETRPNDTSTGSAANKLVVYTSAAQVKTAAVTDTSDVFGICVSGITGTSCGTSGSASVAIAGQASCAFDGATTAGDFVVASTSVAGDCSDAGATVPATVQVLGYVLSTNVGAGTYPVDISNIGAMAALNSKAKPGGTNGQIQYNSSGAFAGVTNVPLGNGGTNATLAASNGGIFYSTASAGAILAGTATAGLPLLSGSSTTPAWGSDANIAYLDTAQAWTKPQRTNTETPAISTATFTPVFSTGQNHRIVLTTACPCTLANPAAIVAGQSGMFEIVQSSTGSNTITTWGSEYEYAGGTSTITLSTANNAADYIPYYVDSTGSFIVLGGIIKGPAH